MASQRRTKIYDSDNTTAFVRNCNCVSYRKTCIKSQAARDFRLATHRYASRPPRNRAYERHHIRCIMVSRHRQSIRMRCWSSDWYRVSMEKNKEIRKTNYHHNSDAVTRHLFSCELGVWHRFLFYRHTSLSGCNLWWYSPCHCASTRTLYCK